MTESISHFMGNDHRHCDELLADALSEHSSGNEEKATELVTDFITAMKRHFIMEEDILFPAFENVSGITQGPTVVMRSEHQQILGLMEQLQDSLKAKDWDEIYAMEETLMILIQQHNMKEENMLYPMCEQFLAGQADTLLNDIQAVEVA